MNQALPRVAFWLVPERNKRDKLQKLINSLAQRYGAISFVPHVTVYSCQRTSQQTELSILACLAKATSMVKLKVDGLDSANQLTKVLTIRLQANDIIQDLHRELHTQVASPSNYKVKPHLSLLYQNPSLVCPEQIASELCLEMTTLDFDEIRAVAIPDRITTLADVADWQTLLICRLAPSQKVDNIDLT